jgi:hypothetical protein
MNVQLVFYKTLVYAVGSDVELARLKVPGDRTIQRAAHVEPAGVLLRGIFRGLRRACGDHGLVANFTRRWPCRWIVNARPIGGPVWGPFSTRESALAWERTQVLDYLLTEIRREAKYLTLL